MPYESRSPDTSKEPKSSCAKTSPKRFPKFASAKFASGLLCRTPNPPSLSVIHRGPRCDTKIGQCCQQRCEPHRSYVTVAERRERPKIAVEQTCLQIQTQKKEPHLGQWTQLWSQNYQHTHTHIDTHKTNDWSAASGLEPLGKSSSLSIVLT